MSVLFYPLIIILSFLQNPGRDYMTIHKDAIVIDTHNDILMRVMEGDNVEHKSKKGHSDLDRFAEGGYDGQVFSIWVDPKYLLHDSAYTEANAMIDSLEAIIRRNPGRIVKVVTPMQFDAALRERNAYRASRSGK